jgi:hypothetical protein
MGLKSLSQRIECARMESWCLGMIKECLSASSMRLGVSFIAPRLLGTVGCILGRPKLPSVGWRTGQSGAPPDSHCSCPVRDFLPFLAQPTVATSGWLAHRTLSGAPSRPLAGATRRARIARPTVALVVVGSPDSPVHHLSAFRDRGVPGPTSEMSSHAPAQMGWREAEREGGKRRPEAGVREVEIPRPSCSSRAQVGCACSRGLQASTRVRERAALHERLSCPRPRAANPL